MEPTFLTLLRFHLRVGVRLALRVLVPIVAAACGAATFFEVQFLRHLGVDHVLDSRDIAFADAVRDLTGGRGVDVVLNSLGGEAMERSLGLLRPFGRFLELGKRDFYLNTRVGLRPLRRNISTTPSTSIAFLSSTRSLPPIFCAR